MKKLFYSFLLLIIVAQLHAQKDFQGVAVYESKMSMGGINIKDAMSDNKEITPEMQKMIEEQVKKVTEKTFILNFDKSASIYKEEEKLGSQGNDGGIVKIMSSISGDGGTLYKNIKERLYVVDKEFLGKEFLIKDSLPKLEWKLESESRKIGDYTCFKATAVRPAETIPSTLKKIYDERNMAKTEDKKSKTNLMDDIEMPTEVAITAWYTPEIPVSQGPAKYWGLPGLILEVNDGQTTVLCSKIIINAKNKSEIKAPTKGQTVTQEKYDTIVAKKKAELMEMNKNGPAYQIRMN